MDTSVSLKGAKNSRTGRCLSARCADDVIRERPPGITDEGQQDRGEDVVPAGARHFALAKRDGSEKEFKRDPGNVENRGSHAGLNPLDCDVAEAGTFEFAHELMDLAERIDDPAIAQFAVDEFLRAAECAGA